MTAQQRIAHRRLYKNHSGQIGYWEGWVEPQDAQLAHIVIQYARTLDGKVTRKYHPATPKNLGRSNATTALEQAQLELDSRTSKQKDKGYVETREQAKAPSTNTLGLLKPMLAKTLEKGDPAKIDWANAWAQPKLDGHRALFKDGVLYSRQGKVLNLPHVVEAIHAAGLAHLHLDGELYLHGKRLQEISSLVKRHQEGTTDIVYHVYDVVMDVGYIDRSITLNMASGRGPGFPPALALLPHTKVATFAELQQLHEENLAAGYEGTMLRWGDKGYQDGKRSRHLLKMKKFQDAEFEIVGVERGVPYVVGGDVYEVPVWLCDAGNGRTFTCTAQGNMYEKHALWETADDHLGKQLTVKFHYLSSLGIPQLPVALRFREDL